jgi:putative pyoverdin transport system ATP-binding/permease protein
MKIFSFLFRISRRAFVLSVLIGFLAGISSAGLIVVINTTYGRGSTRGLILSFTGLGIVMLASNLVSRLLLVQLSQRAIYEMRMHLSRKILVASLDHLENLGAARLFATLTDDIVVITNALLGIPQLCICVSIVILCLIYLGWLSASVLLAFFAVMIVGVASYQGLVIKAMRHLRAARQEQTALFRHYRALTEGIKELKIHRRRREAFLANYLQATSISMCQDSVKGLTYYAAAETWGQFLFFLFIGLLIFILPMLRNVNSSTLAAYTLTMLYITGPLQVILAFLPALGRARIALQQVEALGISLESAGAENVSAVNLLPASSPAILELVNVTHTYRQEYDDTSFTLGPIGLTFQPGEMTFLVGGNGSGKTTLAKIITGLYSSEQGSITLAGERITEESSEYYRQHFSAVFSDFFLFESLLGLENIELDARARAYLSKLRLDQKVSINQGVLSTVDLSRGQRKRLALLTAYLEDRPFYVFDEWASDQDPVFKEIFYMELLPELKSDGKTLIVITHDEKYFHLADRIVELDYGKLQSDSHLGPPAKQLAYVSR